MTASPVADRRILFVTPASPFESTSGAEQRSALFLQALKRIGSVDVVEIVPHADDGDGTAADAGSADDERRRALRITRRPRNGLGRYRADADLIGKIASHFSIAPSAYDLIVGRYIWPCCQVATGRGAPLLADLDDLRYRYSAGSAHDLAAWKERASKWAAWQLVRRQLARFDAAFFASPLDRREHAATLQRSALLRNIPWTLPAQPLPAAAPDSKQLLFVGSLWYRPNSEGVEWFLDRVWPRVIEAEPEAELLLVGAAAPARRARWATRPQVRAPGFIDDLDAAYAASAAVIAPIHSGGGTNIKVPEALARARACVTTRFAYHALADCLEEGRDLLVADDADAFARHCIMLLRDPARRAALGAAAFATSQRHFGRERFFETVTEMAQSLLAPSVAERAH